MVQGAVEHEGAGTDDEPVAVTVLADRAPHQPPALVGVAWSPRVGRAVYAPLRGPSGALGDAGFAVLVPWLADPTRKKVLHDVRSAVGALAELGVTPRGLVGDTALASYRLDPSRIVPHHLVQVAREYLQLGLTTESTVLGTGRSRSQFAAIPVDRAGAFACQQADATGAAWRILQPRLVAEGLLDGFVEVDLPLASILADMERAGVQVDRTVLDALGSRLKSERTALRTTIRTLAGRTFNPASPKQLGQVLFEDLGLPVIKQTKRGPSVDAEVLEQLRDRHPIVPEVQRFRTIDQMIHTYTDVLGPAVRGDGRIHPTYLATLSVSGRLHTTDPDLQRTPLHDPEFRVVREAFGAPEGTVLIAGDWAQMELAVLAHLSGDPTLGQALRNGRDLHRHTATVLFDTDTPTDAQRQAAKAVNYATIYGQGPRALGKRIGVSMSEAKAFVASFFALYPQVRTWREDVVQHAKTNGYVTTWGGRRRYLPEIWAGDPAARSRAERQAVNTPVQGSAADLCKQTMVRLAPLLSAHGARLVLQVHDELLVEAPVEATETVMNVVLNAMQAAGPLNVPMRAVVGAGTCWARAHHGGKADPR